MHVVATEIETESQTDISPDLVAEEAAFLTAFVTDSWEQKPSANTSIKARNYLRPRPYLLQEPGIQNLLIQNMHDFPKRKDNYRLRNPDPKQYFSTPYRYPFEGTIFALDSHQEHARMRDVKLELAQILVASAVLTTQQVLQMLDAGTSLSMKGNEFDVPHFMRPLLLERALNDPDYEQTVDAYGRPGRYYYKASALRGEIKTAALRHQMNETLAKDGPDEKVTIFSLIKEMNKPAVIQAEPVVEKAEPDNVEWLEAKADIENIYGDKAPGKLALLQFAHELEDRAGPHIFRFGLSYQSPEKMLARRRAAESTYGQS